MLAVVVLVALLLLLKLLQAVVVLLMLLVPMVAVSCLTKSMTSVRSIAPRSSRWTSSAARSS